MNLIRLTEITKEGDGTKTQPMLINPEIIATVTTGELDDKEIHIVGQTKKVSVTFLTFRNGQGSFVQESLEEVGNLVNGPK